MHESTTKMPDLDQARNWYRKSDAVHDFDHVIRVYNMAQRLAKEEGADLAIVLAATLLHDVEDAGPGTEERKNHHITSAQFAGKVLQKMGWTAERIAAVQHCIRAHRYRDNNEIPETIEAKILYDADKLDVLGAIGVARTIAYATLANEPIYREPSQHFLKTGKGEPGEAHSAYHEYLFKLRHVKSRLFTDTAKTIAEERHKYITHYFEQLAAETWGER